VLRKLLERMGSQDVRPRKCSSVWWAKACKKVLFPAFWSPTRRKVKTCASEAIRAV
jgi:hypothetical protein